MPDNDMDDLDEIMEEIRANRALIEEMLRARRIAAGQDPDPPKKSLTEIRAETAALRQANNRATQSSRRRQTHLRRVK